LYSACNFSQIIHFEIPVVEKIVCSTTHFRACSHSMIALCGVLGRIETVYQYFLTRISISINIGAAEAGKVDVNLRHFRRLAIAPGTICIFPRRFLSFLGSLSDVPQTISFRPLGLFLLRLLHMLICL
jgi:hypothetical protein